MRLLVERVLLAAASLAGIYLVVSFILTYYNGLPAGSFYSPN